LWRGVLVDELARRVARLGIGKQVEIVDRKVDVGDYLARAHAAVVLVDNGGLVRAFPHSLVESLLAGKPVLLSNTISMADYVSSRKCGIVLPAMNLNALTSAIGSLVRDYAMFARNAAQISPDEFSITALVESYRRLYAT
jgi:glycosyltransferase involved in cell wall biosynthesis